MSFIKQLGPNLEKFYDLLHEYEVDLEEAAANLKMAGKTLEKALKEQPVWSGYYAERKAELSSLVKFLEVQVKKVRGELIVQYNEQYNPKLSDRIMDKYIDREPAVIEIVTKLLEAEELYDKYDSVLDCFNRRGFALRDFTQARINEIQGVTL